MNKTSTDKIRSATPFLIWFRRCLPDTLQDEVRPYLDQPYQLALNVLSCCSTTEPLMVREIAEMAGVTRETARQVLLALKAGGMALDVRPNRGWQSLGEEVTLVEPGSRAEMGFAMGTQPNDGWAHPPDSLISPPQTTAP